MGVSRKVIEDPILGEDSDSYAVQINEHPNASCSNTKNRVQIKRSSKELTHANIGVLLNLDDHFLNLYLNGKRLCQMRVIKKLDQCQFLLTSPNLTLILICYQLIVVGLEKG